MALKKKVFQRSIEKAILVIDKEGKYVSLYWYKAIFKI